MSAYANSIRETSSLVDNNDTLDPHGVGLLLMEVKAHDGPVKYISYSEQRNSIISCCDATRIVKLWNPFSMDMEGMIDQKTMK